MRVKWLDKNKRDGQWLDELDGVAQDGEVVRRPMLLMDSARTQLTDTFTVDEDVLAYHRPGHRALPEKDRTAVRSSRDAMIDRAANSWCTNRGPVDRNRSNHGDRDEAVSLEADAARSAWHQAQGPARPPAVASSVAETIRAPAIEARAAWVRSLGDAWKRPPAIGNPGISHQRAKAAD
jgi:hypothetical protein